MSKSEHVIGNSSTSARDHHRLAAEPLGEAQGVGNTIALLFAQLQVTLSFDADHRPRCMQSVSPSLGIANETRRSRIFTDAHGYSLACCPRTWDRMSLHMREELLIDLY